MENGTESAYNTAQMHFSWYDYFLFTFMLGTSVMIGIYFGCFGKKQNSANEYLLGGKTMKVFPIAMSMIACHISGITVLSIPADIYKYGSNYMLVCVGIIVTSLVAAYITMPVFYELQITSIYEYLKMRFDTKTRLMASLLYNISMILYLPIVIYGPALALAQATPLDLHIVNPIICAICIFYTTIGGLKAVVWTDTLQFSIMLGAFAAVLYIGISAVGGLGTVFSRAYYGERLTIDFDIDPTKRDTFWAVVIGWTINWIPHVAIAQGAVQKFLSMPTFPDVKKAILIFCIGTVLCKGSSGFTGLMVYAKYYDCDPFAIKHIHKNDQLLPYYIMDVANKIPGLPGLFIAGIFCAGLSTLSAQMNSLSGTIYEDFVSRFVSKDITQTQVSKILKLICVVIGVVSTLMVFLVEQLEGILALSISFSGLTAGPLLGLFTLGMVFPTANAKGALLGSILSLIFLAYVLVGAQLYKATGALNYEPKPSSTEGCPANFTVTTNYDVPHDTPEEVFILFRISHYYYSLMGTFIVLVVGLPVSWFTREKNQKPIDRRLITPLMRWAIAEPEFINDEELANLNEKK